MPTVRPARDPRPLAPSLRVAAPLILAATALGCAKDEPTSPEHSSQLLASIGNITGRLFGPDGRNICRTVQEGTMLVNLINPDFDGSNDPFLATQEVTCPDNQFALALGSAGTAHLRTELPINENIDRLPWRNLDEFSVPAGGINHPVSIEQGTRLGGRATLDGEPLEGVPLTLVYDFHTGFGAAFGQSGPDGRWVEFFGRPMILQNDVRYQAVDCFMIGTTLPQGFLFQGFEFPSSRQGVSCRFETAASTRFTHTHTRLKVTPMPGDIGGSFSGELFDQYGVGAGAQFPLPRGESPRPVPPFFSEIFNGGLIIGIPAQNGRPALTLLGADGAGEFECGDPCRDLGLDGEVSFSPINARKSVTWRYSDAGSENAVGLEVVQRSIDGTLPHDYVLFRFRIRNTSPSALRFFAGFFGDLDVEFDNTDDNGATALDGRLMYQVSENESGIHVGTMLLGDAPVTGNYFFTFQEDPLSVPDQIRALRGNISRRTAGPEDLRYIHGAGPITLDPREAKDLWLAVVAGENRSQLIANANAARDKVANLHNTTISDAGETVRMTTVRSSRAATRPCKDCRPR